MNRILTIAGNALIETVRQPVFIIILGAGLFMIAVSPSFAMFTLMNDIKLVKDMGLATILLTGFLQSMFTASNVVSSEIENKTILLILPKPVSRTVFLVGKYLGIVVALALSSYLLTLILLLTIRVGVPEAAYIKLHKPVISGEIFAFAVAVIIALLANYFHDRSFCSSFFGYSLVSFTIVFLILGFIDKELKFQRFCTDIDLQVVKASYLILVGVVTFAAVAITLSTRFGLVLTIGFCICIFILGLLSDHIFGRIAGTSFPARLAYAVLPNMQVFWVTDAVVSEQVIPAKYLVSVTRYALLYQIAMLALGVMLFETREIG